MGWMCAAKFGMTRNGYKILMGMLLEKHHFEDKKCNVIMSRGQVLG
jgi:hypothetical protein